MRLARNVLLAPALTFLVACGDGSTATTPPIPFVAVASEDAATANAPRPTPHCFGNPPPCSSLSPQGCGTVAGCGPGALTCIGMATSCPTLPEALCNAQDGCAWNITGQTCTGTAIACPLFGEGACTKQLGCSPMSSCSGTAMACEGLSIDVCAAQPGCRWGVPPTLDASSDAATVAADTNIDAGGGGTGYLTWNAPGICAPPGGKYSDTCQECVYSLCCPELQVCHSADGGTALNVGPNGPCETLTNCIAQCQAGVGIAADAGTAGCEASCESATRVTDTVDVLNAEGVRACANAWCSPPCAPTQTP